MNTINNSNLSFVKNDAILTKTPPIIYVRIG